MAGAVPWQEVGGEKGNISRAPPQRAPLLTAWKLPLLSGSTREQDALQFEILILQEALEERSTRATSVQDSFSEEYCSAASPGQGIQGHVEGFYLSPKQ